MSKKKRKNENFFERYKTHLKSVNFVKSIEPSDLSLTPSVGVSFKSNLR